MIVQLDRSMSVLFSSILCLTFAGKILFVPAHNIVSHTKSMQPLAKALKKSGHQITFLQIADKHHPVHDVQFSEQISLSVDRLANTNWNGSILWTSRANGPVFFSKVFKMAGTLCGQLTRPAPNKHGIMNDKVATMNSMYAAFANLTATPWDLVIVDSIFAPCGVYIALQGSFIDYSTTIMYYHSARAKQITTPVSVRPGTQMAHFESHAFGAKDIPKRIRRAMLGAFLKLTDYRIIWQPVETNEVPNADHILPTQWVPQTDILAHPKTVAFVTHMGYKSFREGLCAQVPLVAMPVFAEQYFNAAVVLQKGLGVFLNKMDTSTEALSSERPTDGTGGFGNFLDQLFASEKKRSNNVPTTERRKPKHDLTE